MKVHRLILLMPPIRFGHARSYIYLFIFLSLSHTLETSIMMTGITDPKTILQMSDEDNLYQCGPCESARRNKAAHHFCDDCKEYLCNDCRDSHRLFKISKNHKILSGNTMPMDQKKRVAEFCSCNQNKEVAIFCDDHNDVICMSCKALIHRKCKTLTIQEKSETYTSEKFGFMFSKAKDLKKKIESLLSLRNSDIGMLEEAKEKCKAEVENFRKELNSTLDHLQEDVVAQLSKIESNLRQSIKRHTETLSVALDALERDYQTAESASKEGRVEKMFAVDVRVTKRLRDYETVFEDIQKDAFLPALQFESSKMLTALQKEADTFGTIRLEKVYHKQAIRKSISKLKLQRSQKVKIKILDDKCTPYITGCVFLADGWLVLCDHWNNRVKMLNQLWTLTSHLDVFSAPWDVTALDQQNIVVTLPDARKLLFNQTFPVMKVVRTVELDKNAGE